MLLKEVFVVCGAQDACCVLFFLDAQVVEWLVGGTNSTPQPQNGSSKAADAAAAAAVAGAQAWDGLIVLDECHKAKNFTPGKEAQSTKVG
jgi:hypothetical protein